MFHKKIFVRVVMMLFIVSMTFSAADLSFAAQKIREGLNFFDSANYKGAISLLDEISALKLNTAYKYNLRSEYLVKIGEYHYYIMNYDKGKELFDLAIRDYDSASELPAA